MISPDKWQIVIWGHPLHSHTHSYIHNAFDRAFRHLGFRTHWLHNDHPDLNQIDFARSIFLTEGQVDQNIPIRDDCFYILHNCYDEKYKTASLQNKTMVLQVYTDDVLKYNMSKIDDCIYADYGGRGLYMPWATDALPHEIETYKPSIPFNRNSKKVFWVGTVGGGEFGNIDEITPFKRACEENQISFEQVGGRSVENGIDLIKQSYMAPTIVGSWQGRVGYIPCRIFKNISYGQFGLTNSARVYELFQHKIVFNNDTSRLFYDAKERLENIQLNELIDLMDFVKNKHTYISRINTILDFIDKVS